MIRIERLRIRLPAHLRAHAQTIARELGQALAAAEIDTVGYVARCDLSPIRVAAGVTPRAVAQLAGQRIVQQIGKGQP